MSVTIIFVSDYKDLGSMSSREFWYVSEELIFTYLDILISGNDEKLVMYTMQMAKGKKNQPFTCQLSGWCSKNLYRNKKNIDVIK